MDLDRQSLDEWAKDKPLSILQLDPADRAVLKIADERDAIQKKTFTKWVNKHLKKAGRQVRDLFEDLRDGHSLISLLEVLSGEHLPRDRGKLRFHMLHNVQVVLDFLRFKKIKLVNIRCEDIVDGNPKLTLGLIWTIILHFQISDIVVGQTDNVTAKEALLRWARKTTHKYPDVRVSNFTTSWRDGLAMVAIIHRNRPDLVDWRHLRQRSARDRLETAFHVMEKEYGVTRLLDPEDVDTPEPDEKSLITYISQLYEIFPDPPSIHPLFNIEAQRKLEEYQELSTQLLVWIREHIGIMKDRRFPSNTVELKRIAQESTRFRQDEVPPRLRDKNKCQTMFREIQRLLDGTGIMDDLPQELHYPRIDSEWNKLMSLFQERDDALHDHLSGADRLQRLADKIGRDIQHTEVSLEEVEVRIEEEARRVERLHPMDAKRNCDGIDDDLGQCEDTIRNLHSDVKVLKDNKYHEATGLTKRVVKLEERYVSVRTLFENRLLIVLNNKTFTQQESFTTTKRIVVSESRLVETNEDFKFLQECINWCKDKLRKLNDSDYGNDLAAVEKEYESHQKEHKIIHQFHTNVDQCAGAETNFSGDEKRVYIDLLSQLRKTYADLLSSSNKRVSDLFSLLEFLQSATQELIWLNEKEDTELNRDWANKSLNIPDVERYHESLMNELEKRESQFSSVQDRGNALVISQHPASKTVEAYLAAMQTQWQWLLELMLCLETHLHHASYYHTFFTDVAKAEQWVMAQDERLNTTYSVTDFGLDDGEQLLREMQDIREGLAQFSSTVDELITRSKSVVPLKQRRQTLRQPTAATAICNYKKMDISISKGERCVVHDNSNRVKWRVNAGGTEAHVPGVISLFLLLF